MNNDRRSFIRKAGVAVTAAAAAGSAAASTQESASLEHRLGLLEDSDAIRALQQRYFVLAQQGKVTELATLFATRHAPAHSDTVLDTRIDDTQLDVAADRQSASATLRARVLLATPLTGNGTLQQMARLQGQTEQQWSETGIYSARYIKQADGWKISALEYRKA